jgi:hypothetical protein
MVRRRCAHPDCGKEVEHRPVGAAKLSSGRVIPRALVPVPHQQPDGQPCPNGRSTRRR